MDKLFELIADIGSELHPDRVQELSDKIRRLESVQEFGLLKPLLSTHVEQDRIIRFEKEWLKRAEIGPATIAGGLLGASAASVKSDAERSVELVWTGPSTGIVPVRHTEQVLLQVIESARKNLFFVSYVAFNVASVIQALNRAAARSVSITTLLELPKGKGGAVNVDSLKTLKEGVPTARIMAWKQKAGKEGHGAVHAKCIVADGRIAFITSANLTAAAMERNMEMGVLLKGGPLPNELHRHLEALITTGLVKKF